MDLIDECAILGASLLAAQKFEYALYGVISHLSHLPEAQKEKRFKNLGSSAEFVGKNRATSRQETVTPWSAGEEDAGAFRPRV